jgi:hypothetical protein
MTGELFDALSALALAFDAEASAHAAEAGGAEPAWSIRREAAQTRLMAERIRPMHTSSPTWEPDDANVRAARAWLQSGMERVRVMQARRSARAIEERAL